MNAFWQRRFERNSAIVIGAEAKAARLHQELAAGAPAGVWGGGPRIARRHHRVTGTIADRRSTRPHTHPLHTAPVHRGCRVGLNVTTIGARQARDMHPGFSAAVQMPASAEGQPVVIAPPEDPPSTPFSWRITLAW
jgi:hypothetical protein